MSHSEPSSVGSPEKGGGTRWSLISAGLQEAIRTQGISEVSSAGKLTTLSSTIRSRPQLFEDLVQAVVDVLGAVDQRLEGGRDEGAELFDRRFAEDRRRVADEVLPELARDFLGLRRRGQPHQPLLEPFLLERAGERLLDDEDDAVAAAFRGRRAIPTQLLVGPKAPSGKKTIVERSALKPNPRSSPG